MFDGRNKSTSLSQYTENNNLARDNTLADDGTINQDLFVLDYAPAKACDVGALVSDLPNLVVNELLTSIVCCLTFIVLKL